MGPMGGLIIGTILHIGTFLLRLATPGPANRCEVVFLTKRRRTPHSPHPDIAQGSAAFVDPRVLIRGL